MIAIPDDIIPICALFYGQKERFDAWQHGKGIRIRNDERITTKWSIKQTAFGSVIIIPKSKLLSTSTIKWTLKSQPSRPYPTCCSLSIGLVSASDDVHDTVESDFLNFNSIYGLSLDESALITTDKTCNKSGYKRLNMHRDWHKTNIFEMELNIKERTIRYIINEKNYGLAFWNINLNQNYKLAVCINDQLSVELIDFKITFS